MSVQSEISYLRFRAFQFLWLMFILFHMAISIPGWSRLGDGFLNPGNYLFLLLNILVVVFATISLFRPRQLRWFWLSVAALTAVKLEALPAIPNHIILTLFIHFTLLIGLLLYWKPSLESQKKRIAHWFERVAPYLRIELLIVYFFVVLHKINHDFFNPEVSCATELYNGIAAIYPFWPQGPGINELVISMTMLSEVLIPLLLILPATRTIGILFGIVFHFMLSLHPNLYILSFTAELYALFVLFLPGEILLRAHKIFTSVTKGISIRQIMKNVTAAGLLTAVVYPLYRILTRGEFTFSAIKSDYLGFVMGLWILWSLLLFSVALLLFHSRWLYVYREKASFFRLSWSPLLLIAALTFFNGLTPYIGLKTATNFAMFSNLRVEGADTNHLFLPSTYQISDRQADTVTLLDTNHPYLQNYIEWNERITYFELSRFLYENSHEDIEVAFLRRGDEYRISLREHPPEEWLDSGWLARKMMLFRGVPIEGPTPCQW